MKLDIYADQDGVKEAVLLKVETEGMEVEVLDGASSVLTWMHQVASGDTW